MRDIAKDLGFDYIVLRHVTDTDSPLNPDDEEDSSEFIRKFTTHIIGQREEDGEDTEECLGMCSGWVYHGGYSLEADVSIIDVADAIDGETCGVAELVFGGPDALVEDLHSEWGGSASNVLYLHTLWLDPKYRGRDLGLVAIRRVLEHFDPCSLLAVLLLPVPKHFFSKGQHRTDPLAKKSAATGLRKLTEYYGKMGFKPWRDSKYLLLRMEEYDFQWRYKTEKSSRKTKLSNVS